MKSVYIKNSYILYIFFIFLFHFISCTPNIKEPIENLKYETPYIIRPELNIGLFSPFEVPLIAEREYEFTLTTDYKYVRVHFTTETNDIWVSLRKIDPKLNIFSQNLFIPKGTTSVEIGVADRPNSKNNDVLFYAQYDVEPLDTFKSIIKDEEERREYEEQEIDQRDILKPYEKIIINHKYNSKYPKALKRGETYIFEIGPFDNSYCIFNSSNADNFLWLPIEKDKNKYFKTIYQIPTDAENFRIALSSTSTTFIESLVSFELTGNLTENMNRVEDEQIIISSSSMSYLDINIYDERIYKISVDSFSSNYKYCYIECLSENNILDRIVLDRIKDKYETNCFYIPSGTSIMNIYLTNDYFSYSNKIAQLYVQHKESQNPLIAGSKFNNANLIKTDKPDEDLTMFLDINNARNLGKTNPDYLVDLCIDYIDKNSFDNFHKVKLLHDTIWYLTSYDYDSLEINDYKPYDFRTVLSRGLCVCAGFSRTFVYFCDRMNIRAIYVLGNYLEGNEKTISDIEEIDHAWTIIEIDDAWYLFDLTWDCSGTRKGKCDKYYSCKYFCVDPEDFIKNHYPVNSEKQLFEKPYSSFDILKMIMNNRW